jgi:hypothetical protein
MKDLFPFILICLLAAQAPSPAYADTIDEILGACRTDADQRAGAPALPPAAAKPGAAKKAEAEEPEEGAAPKPKPTTKPKRKPRGSSFAYLSAQKAALAGNGEEALDRLLECPQAEAAEDELRDRQDYVVKRLIEDAGVK